MFVFLFLVHYKPKYMVYNVYQIQICFKPYTLSMCKYKHNMSFVLEKCEHCCSMNSKSF